jgi:phage tail-like protein
MPQFTVNTHRFDPYKNFKFRVKWDGRAVAGVSEVSPLRRVTEVIRHREGGEPSSERKSPGRTRFEPVTLRRGVTHDREFEAWANSVWLLSGNPEAALKTFRKDIVIELYNEAGQLAIAYKLYRCWVSAYEALSTLQADAGGIAFESITIENEGWERDPDVQEPAEPGQAPNSAQSKHTDATTDPRAKSRRTK